MKSSRAICDGIDLITTDSCGNREVHEACLYGCRGSKCTECEPIQTRTAVYSDFKAKNPRILLSKRGPLVFYAKFSQERLGYTMLSESGEEHTTLTSWGDKDGFFLDVTWDKVTKSLVISHWGEKDETLRLTTEHPEVTTRTLQEMPTKSMYQAFSCIDTDAEGHFHIAWVECTSSRSMRDPFGDWYERCEEMKLRYGTNSAGRFKSEVVAPSIGVLDRRCAIQVKDKGVQIAFHADDLRMCLTKGRAGQWELNCSEVKAQRAAFDFDTEGRGRAAYAAGIACDKNGDYCQMNQVRYVTMGSWAGPEDVYITRQTSALEIAVSPKGLPQIAFANLVAYPKSEVWHCEKRDNWTCIQLDDGTRVGDDMSMLVSKSGKTHMVYTVEDQVVYAGGYQCPD